MTNATTSWGAGSAYEQRTLTPRGSGGWKAKVKAPPASVSGEGCFLAHRRRLLAVSSCGGRGWGPSGVSVVRALIPFRRAPPSGPNPVPKARLPGPSDAVGMRSFSPLRSAQRGSARPQPPQAWMCHGLLKPVPCFWLSLVSGLVLIYVTSNTAANIFGHTSRPSGACQWHVTRGDSAPRGHWVLSGDVGGC